MRLSKQFGDQLEELVYYRLQREGFSPRHIPTHGDIECYLPGLETTLNIECKNTHKENFNLSKKIVEKHESDCRSKIHEPVWVIQTSGFSPKAVVDLSFFLSLLPKKL